MRIEARHRLPRRLRRQRNGWLRVSQWPATAMILCVRMYQRGISPLIGPCCRFQPTCSEYMVASIRKRGAIRGVVCGLWRIARCHPFAEGGYDPP